MKAGSFIIFFTIVLTIYFFTNLYIFTRGMQAIPQSSATRLWIGIAFWFFVCSFVAGRVLERTHLTGLSTVLTWTGSFWLGFMFYSLLAVLLIDLSRVINHFAHIYPHFFYTDYPRTKLITLIVTVSIVSVIILGGFINTLNPRIKRLEFGIPKEVRGEKELTIVMASDIHLGTIVGKNRAEYLVNRINSLNPDIILLAGDIVDEDLRPVIRQNIGERLTQLKARFGVWAITGNHEYIGGVSPAVNYLMAHNITFLRDSFVLVDNRFYLVGREDRDRPRFTGKPRKSLEEVMAGIDLNYPVIVMDHQPFNLPLVAAQGADLQVSGHTHHGQMFPINLITNAIYEVSHGFKKIGKTNFYVSTGFGTWGPPVRIGTRPEIVLIRLVFK